jgi:hypothetical protein
MKVRRIAHAASQETVARGNPHMAKSVATPRTSNVSLERSDAATIGSSMRTGEVAVLEGLIANGVKMVFGVPGPSFLEVLDSLYGGPVQFISCRHEEPQRSWRRATLEAMRSDRPALFHVELDRTELSVVERLPKGAHYFGSR